MMEILKIMMVVQVYVSLSVGMAFFNQEKCVMTEIETILMVVILSVLFREALFAHNQISLVSQFVEMELFLGVKNVMTIIL